MREKKKESRKSHSHMAPVNRSMSSTVLTPPSPSPTPKKNKRKKKKKKKKLKQLEESSLMEGPHTAQSCRITNKQTYSEHGDTGQIRTVDAPAQTTVRLARESPSCRGRRRGGWGHGGWGGGDAWLYKKVPVFDTQPSPPSSPMTLSPLRPAHP